MRNIFHALCITMKKSPIYLSCLEVEVFINNSPLLENILKLQEYNKSSNRQLSKKTKGAVSDRHIGNIKNNESSPTLEVMKGLANAFGIEIWQLLLPDVSIEMLFDKNLQEIINHYLTCDQEGRDLILVIAKQQSLLKKDTKKSEI